MNIILLAGGRGSRSENPQLPKVLQELTPGVTILDHWIQLLANQGFKKLELILGHEHQQISARLDERGVPPELEVTRTIDDRLSGTTNAVLYSQFFGEQSLVLMADTLSFLDYGKVLSNFDPKASQVAFLAHKNSHFFDSDIVEISRDGLVRSFYKKRESGNFHNVLALTGGVLLGPDAWGELEQLQEKGDLVHDLFSTIPLSRIHVAPFVGLSMDCGTSQRLERARNLYSFWMARENFPVVILDRDGTLVRDIPAGRLPGFPLEIDPRDAEAISRINEYGIPVFMVTNQPAIAKGWITSSDVEEVHASIELELAKYGAWLDDIVYCPHHPESGHPGELPELKIECSCRKPNTELLKRLIAKYQLQGCDIWVVGDSEVDKAFASKSSAKFIRAEHMSEGNIAAAVEGMMNDWNRK